MRSTTRRRFLSGAAAALASRNIQGQAGSRPNILWITCEDMSPDLGCYGDAYSRTPNLDRFAKESARYTHVFSTYPVCAPSRSSIITAMYPQTIGTQHMRSEGVPPPSVKCFPEYLRAAGYYCTNNIKTDYNFPLPLTAWDESSNRSHWRNRKKGQPFFSVFNLTVTHESQIRETPERFAEQTRRLRAEDRHDPAKATLPPYYADTPVVRRDWANYYDLITAMDLQFADILGQLEEDGLAGNTVVFFYSDHGRGLPRAKRWVYDSGIHVPLMIRWPGTIKGGASDNRLVSLMDTGPTALSIAGVPVPKHMQGRAFLGPAEAQPRQHIFAGRDRMDETYDLIRAVRDHRWKYIRNYQAGKPYAQYIDYMDQMPTMREWRKLNKDGKLVGPQRIFFSPEKPLEELYDTQADPHEVKNLAADPSHRLTLERLRKVHERWTRDIQDTGHMSEEKLKERMRPGGVWSVTSTPELSPPGGTHRGPVRIKASCATEGSSIAWTTGDGPTPHWKLYTDGIDVDSSATVRLRACRIGYKDSPEARAEYRIS